MSASQVIVNYELLAALSAQMLAAAEQGAWEQLIGFENQRSQLLETIKSADAVAALDEAAQARKKQLIEKILADDAHTRNFTQSGLGQLQLSITSNKNELRLRLAYGV